MSHPCQFKVHKQTRGVSKKETLANFADQTDAINYAHATSVGKYNQPDVSIAVIYGGRKVLRFQNGVRK